MTDKAPKAIKQRIIKELAGQVDEFIEWACEEQVDTMEFIVHHWEMKPMRPILDKMLSQLYLFYFQDHKKSS